MDAALYAHLEQQDAPRVGYAVRCAFDERILRVCSAGTVEIDGELFTAEDPIYGTLGVVGPISDGTGDQATRGEVQFLPPASGVADEYLLDVDGEVITDVDDDPILVLFERSFLEHAERPRTQLTLLTIWWFAVEPASGLLVGEPEGAFSCLTDVPSVDFSATSWSVTFDCMSVLDYALQADEGFRLNGAHHKSVWPSEAGCDAVTGLSDPSYWGATRPNAITFRPGSRFARWVGG